MLLYACKTCYTPSSANNLYVMQFIGYGAVMITLVLITAYRSLYSLKLCLGVYITTQLYIRLYILLCVLDKHILLPTIHM